MEMEDNRLVLRFDPHTIEHLGVKMYSQLPHALAELVANAYDAASTNVSIHLSDSDPSNKTITVIDDGDGMSYEEVQDNFLIIGRKRREYDTARLNSKNRRITGRKGVGKLALFGIGKNIQIETTRCGDANKTRFSLDWDDILSETSGQYNPPFEIIKKKDPEEHGTTIVLSRLTRVSDFNENDIAISLSKLFNCFSSDFKVSIARNNSEPLLLTRDMLYDNINQQFSWRVEDIVNVLDGDYRHKANLKGLIVSSEKPIKPDLRGISLYSNGRLVNTAGFFGVPEAGHTFTYLSGWIDADFLDEMDDDLISTDRQSLSWDLPETKALQAYLQKIMRYLVKDWSEKRKKVKEERMNQRSGVNISNWASTMPDDMKKPFLKVVDKISSSPSIDDDDYSNVIKDLHEALPDYPIYHWRNLHDSIKSVSELKYKNGDYYGALTEACKGYVKAVRAKSISQNPDKAQIIIGQDDGPLMMKVFNENPKEAMLHIAQSATRPDGTPFDDKTKGNLESAQRYLSAGIVSGYRNPLSHETHKDLSMTGVITEQHCLDALSLLSLLYRRLDNAE